MDSEPGWEHYEETLRRRYYEEPVIFTWTQAELDRHQELRNELKEILRNLQCLNS